MQLLLLPGGAPVDELARAAHRAGHHLVLATAPGSVPDAVISVGDSPDPRNQRCADRPPATEHPTLVVTSDDLRDEPDTVVARAAALGPTPAPTARPAGLRRALAAGVSHLTPLVTAGGLLAAVGYLLGAPHLVQGAAPTWNPSVGPAAMLTQLGWLALSLIAPVLGAAVAHAVAGRPAIAPGVVGGAVALITGAGYLGGLAAGVVAGAVVLAGRRWRPSRSRAGLWYAMLLPMLATAASGLVVALALAQPLAALGTLVTTLLSSLSVTGGLVFGLVAGMLVAIDLGGPVSKTVYTSAVAGLAAGAPNAPAVMAAVMAAGMVPPLAAGAAALVRPMGSSRQERAQGRTALVLGAGFVTEGAIPLVATDPLRVMPSLLLGSGVSGALAMLLSAGVPAPHGGLAVITLMTNPAGFLIALAAGTAVAAALIIALRSSGATRTGRTVRDWSRREHVPAAA